MTKKFKICFIPVEDKPGYYYLDKYTIISEKVLKKVINEYNERKISIVEVNYESSN